MSATRQNYFPGVTQATAPERRCRQRPGRSRQEVLMRAYVEVVLTIVGLLGAYIALLPLVT
jgi:hypothetical protein